MIDQYLPHEPGGHHQKMRPVVAIERPLLKQPQIGLMNQCGALQCVSWALPPQLLPG